MNLPPDYINDWITGDDRTLLETFYNASNSEGGSADEVILRGLKAVLAQSRVVPVPVTERLPGPEDCDAEGQCWWFHPEDESQWDVWCYSRGNGLGTHWLPANALPLPAEEV